MNKEQIIKIVLNECDKEFRCPKCGSSHYGSWLKDDKMYRHCNGCHGHVEFPASEDDKYFIRTVNGSKLRKILEDVLPDVDRSQQDRKHPFSPLPATQNPRGCRRVSGL